LRTQPACFCNRFQPSLAVPAAPGRAGGHAVRRVREHAARGQRR